MDREDRIRDIDQEKVFRKSEEQRNKVDQKIRKQKKEKGRLTGSLNLRKPELPNLSETDLDNRRVYLGVFAVFALLATGFYFDVHERILMEDGEIAMQVAEENEFISEYQENNPAEDISTAGINPERVQSMREGGQLPENSSDNVHVVDYTNTGATGVSAYVDVSNREVVNTQYNLKFD